MEKQNMEVSDGDNEQFLFSLTSNYLLGRIVKGETDPILIAKKTLAGRGYDENGMWIGFDEARMHFGLLDHKNA